MKKNVIAIVTVAAAMTILPVTTTTIPAAKADPNVCETLPGVPIWSNPCYAQNPPWNDPNWAPTDTPGKWGPHGYTPCNKPSGFCY